MLLLGGMLLKPKTCSNPKPKTGSFLNEELVVTVIDGSLKTGIEK